MTSTALKHARTIFTILLLILGFALAAPARAQFEIVGFGLSGNGDGIDSTISAAEPIYVVLEVNLPEGWHVLGVARQDSIQWQLRGYFYDLVEPEGNPTTTEYLDIDSATFQVDTTVMPQRIRFRSLAPSTIADNINSLQCVLLVYGRDSDDSLRYSEVRSSFLQIGDILPVNNPVDEAHAEYLRVEPAIVSRPGIISPASNDIVGRAFSVVFSQPLDAVANSLRIEIRETGESGIFEMHNLFLSDTLAGESKQIVVNSLNLAQSIGVDSITGFATLNHNSRLRFRIYYTISGLPGGPATPSDTVSNVVADLLTDDPFLNEPRVGSQAQEPNIRVIYSLPEIADTVQMIFTADTLTQVPDPQSPHILTISMDHIAAGEHYFILDGTNIGTGGPNVLFNVNGTEDSLIDQTIYNVTLSYGDASGNPIRSVTNSGYVWPNDGTTIPATILAPAANSTENSSFWVQFELPEAPLPGSVELRFFGIPSYPGAQHVIHLGNLAAAGVHGLFLNGRALDLSGPPVTSVDGGTQFRHEHRYNIFVFYQDALGNSEIGSQLRVVRYDDATEPPVILAPADGDSFSYAGTELSYSQVEHAAPGTLRLTIEQTGGPEHDLYSPHTLYLSQLDSGSTKSLVFQPTFLGAGPGVDSVTNPGSLVPRGLYQVTLSYQDTLLNEAASEFVRDIYFPSGSSVLISGDVISTEIVPGASNRQLMQFTLRSVGESSLRGLTLEVAGGFTFEDILTNRMIIWSSSDSLLQTALDTPLDSLDTWFGGPMVWDSFAVPLNEIPRHVLISGSFRSDGNPANAINLILQSSEDVDCGGDPVLCMNCPVGLPDIPLPAMVSSIYLEDDTTFNSLVVNWIVESEYNTLGFRLWRHDDENDVTQAIASYATDENLYGRGTAATAKRYFYVDRGLRTGVIYTYSLQIIGIDGLTEFAVPLTVSGTPSVAPSEFTLKQIYPNPFNQVTTIEYIVPFAEKVELTIYNLLGQPVRVLANAQLAPAVYRSVWDGRNEAGITVPSGLYLVRLKAAGRYDSTKKLLLVR